MDDDIVPDSDPFAPFDRQLAQDVGLYFVIPPGTHVPMDSATTSSLLTPLPDVYLHGHQSPRSRSTSVVPDSDPPYPAHIQLLIPYERTDRPAPNGTGSFMSPGPTAPRVSIKPSEEDRAAYDMVDTAQSLYSFPSCHVPIQPTTSRIYIAEEMIENVETLCTWSPQRPLSPLDVGVGGLLSTSPEVMTGTTNNMRLGAGAIDVGTSTIEEPTSDDELECRRRMEFEMDMDDLIYGSFLYPPQDVVNEGFEDISTKSRDTIGPERLEEKFIHERERIEVSCVSPENGSVVGVERSSSVFEEAQRPPWLDEDRRARRVQFAIYTSEEESDNEIIPATHPEWPESIGIFSRIQRELEAASEQKDDSESG
ncbi:hypothetical protein QFC22_006548 [Naganishia vaughanmartiniae]|uniref:Uncharacterized protein n=1 Tax=Naganishia vaughanmartiniae TaxID=1424756 RepID=A0ACC2WHL2_9TREE|nr:hypothetical protein QFC22_006548 [Naganishia vaughanmartiniae]